MKKIITGNWEGQPIWREQTAGEALLEEIENNKIQNHE